MVIADKDAAAGEAAVTLLGPRATFLKLDVRDSAAWSAAWQEAEQFFGGPVQVLMNNAGLFSRTDWKLMLDVNLGGLANGTMLAMEKMSKANGGPGGTIGTVHDC